MMHSLNLDYAAGLLETCEPPCLSLYQPTHRHHPDNQQDPIRFRNQVKALEKSLLQKYPAQEVEPLLAPFLTLADDRDFWNHTLDGLAVLSAKGVFRVYKLQRPVAELFVVADSFHIKPLLRILQSVDRFQVLALSLHAMRLFEGNRDALDEIEPAEGVPRTITEALGDELTEPHLTVASYGGAGGAAMHHGQGGKSPEVDKDAERFFRAVDQAILERHSQPTKLPLILAALPEHQPIFHRVSRNQFLMSEGLEVHPDSLTADELRQRAWKLLEPHYFARLDALAEEFKSAQATGLGGDDLEEVAKAVVTGKVATLLIESRRVIPGRIDAETGVVALADMADPEVDDVLDDLAERALRMGGAVAVIPTERMPSESGVAAIYRY